MAKHQLSLPSINGRLTPLWDLSLSLNESDQHKTIHLTIQGIPPIPWTAPRFSKTQTGRTRVISEEKYRDWRESMRTTIQLKSGGIDRSYLERDVSVEAYMWFFYPDGVADQPMIPRIKKPDLDNLCKAVADICKGIIIPDDCTIWRLTAEKLSVADQGVGTKAMFVIREFS